MEAGGSRKRLGLVCCGGCSTGAVSTSLGCVGLAGTGCGNKGGGNWVAREAASLALVSQFWSKEHGKVSSESESLTLEGLVI